MSTWGASTAGYRQNRTLIDNSVKKLTIIAACAVLLTSCAAPSQVMVRASDGSSVRCAAGGIGVIGAPAALIMQNGCISDYRDLGYVTLEEYQASKAAASKGMTATPTNVTADMGGKISQDATTVDGVPSVVTSKEGGYKLTLSPGWEKRQNPESIKNMAGAAHYHNKKLDLYFIIVTDPISDISNVEEFAKSRKTAIATTYKDSEFTEISKLKANGFDTLQYGSSISANGVRLRYSYYYVTLNERLARVTMYASASKFNDAQPEIEAVISKIDAYK